MQAYLDAKVRNARQTLQKSKLEARINLYIHQLRTKQTQSNVELEQNIGLCFVNFDQIEESQKDDEYDNLLSATENEDENDSSQQE